MFPKDSRMRPSVIPDYAPHMVRIILPTKTQFPSGTAPLWLLTSGQWVSRSGMEDTEVRTAIIAGLHVAYTTPAEKMIQLLQGKN